jgi:hypothetical protein
MRIVSAEFRHNRSVGCIFCIRTILREKWQKKVCYSVRREVLHNIPVESGIPMKVLS